MLDVLDRSHCRRTVWPRHRVTSIVAQQTPAGHWENALTSSWPCSNVCPGVRGSLSEWGTTSEIEVVAVSPVDDISTHGLIPRIENNSRCLIQNDQVAKLVLELMRSKKELRGVKNRP